MLTDDSRTNTGYNWLITVISITLESPKPSPTPTKVDAVNWDTLFPDMSPILFLFANLTLILARDADESKKQTFLPTLATEASRRKW